MASKLKWLVYRAGNLCTLLRDRGYRGRKDELTGIWQAIAEEAGINALKCSAAEVGRVFAVTFEERTRLKLRTIRAYRVTAEEIEAHRRKKLDADAERKRKARARLAAQREADKRARDHAQDLNVRVEAILVLLIRPMTIAELAAALASHAAFLSADGQRLPLKSLKRAIQRAVLALWKARLVVIEKRKSVRGTPEYFVRRTPKIIPIPLRPRIGADG